MQQNSDMITNPKLFQRSKSYQNGTPQLHLSCKHKRGGRLLTEDIHVGTSKEGTMLITGLTMVHSSVLKLKVGKAELPIRDSPSEGPTCKDPDHVRRWC